MKPTSIGAARQRLPTLPGPPGVSSSSRRHLALLLDPLLCRATPRPGPRVGARSAPDHAANARRRLSIRAEPVLVQRAPKAPSYTRPGEPPPPLQSGVQPHRRRQRQRRAQTAQRRPAFDREHSADLPPLRRASTRLRGRHRQGRGRHQSRRQPGLRLGHVALRLSSAPRDLVFLAAQPSSTWAPAGTISRPRIGPRAPKLGAGPFQGQRCNANATLRSATARPLACRAG
jgi:hypothetical protein